MAVQGNFRRDLARGVKAEIYVAKRLQKDGFDVIRNTSKDIDVLKDWDLKFKKKGKIKTMEVKNDIMSKWTGNVGFEIGQGASSKPSCLLTTKADYWCHVFYKKEEAFISIMNTGLLRQRLFTPSYYRNSCFKNKGKFVLNVGDNNADIIIVSIEDYLDFFEGTLWTLTTGEAIKEGLW